MKRAVCFLDLHGKMCKLEFIAQLGYATRSDYKLVAPRPRAARNAIPYIVFAKVTPDGVAAQGGGSPGETSAAGRSTDRAGRRDHGVTGF